MPIDYPGFVASLAEASALVGHKPELVAIDALVTALREATGAAGATFTEYGEAGGRVVVAQQLMAWALGRPVPGEMVRPDAVVSPYQGWIEAVPPEAAGPLRARDVVAVAGHPVWVGERVAGGVHLYFTDLSNLPGGPPAPAPATPDSTIQDLTGPDPTRPDSTIQDLTGPDPTGGQPASPKPAAPATEPHWPELMALLQVTATFAGCIYTGREATPVRPAGEEDDCSLFLAVAGHELRTPVTVIKGYASLLADRWDSLDEDQRRSAAGVLTQRADELARLVDRLLGTSIGDSRHGGLVRQVPFDPLDALLQAASSMPAQLRRAIRMELPNWLPPASGDPEVIGTVVTELVTNAVRAGGNGVEPEPSSVDVTAGADADTVYIRVLDRGVGIDPAEVERAFERFWRGTRSAGSEADARHGVGLGLYLVRRLVERQNGWVSLRPRDGGGTIAEVRLARADGPHRPVSPPDGEGA